MTYEINREALFKETEDILDALTNPVFINTLQDFRATPIKDRFDFAEKNMTPKILKSKGVALPDEVRVSSRTFEEGDSKIPLFVDYAEGKRILDLITENEPDLIEALKTNNADVYEKFIGINDLPDELINPNTNFPNEIPELIPNNGIPDGTFTPNLNPSGRTPIDPDNPEAPFDPLGTSPIDPNDPNAPFNPYATWACACGGAATACAGAGGGT